MIDWAHVKQLECDVGVGDFTAIVELFLEEVDAEIEQLRTPPATAEQFKAKMHFLKGSAYYLGFTAFGNLCAQNEVLADTEHLGDIDLAGLIATYEESRRQFLKEAPNHCGFVAAA